MGATQNRTCELAWLVPWWRGGRRFVGESSPDSSERRQQASSSDEIIAHIRRVGREVWEEFGAYPAVSLEGLGDPDLYATAVEDRWHFWYLAEGGDVSLRSVGDELAEGASRVIFCDFKDVPNAELLPRHGSIALRGCPGCLLTWGQTSRSVRILWADLEVCPQESPFQDSL